MHRIVAYLITLMFLAVPSWAATLNFTLSTGGGDGTVVDTTNPSGFYDNSFALVGSDTGTFQSVVTTYTAVAPDPAPLPLWQVSGDWSYLSTDINGPFYDPFGYIINDVKTQLTDNSGPMNQVGSFSFLVAEGDVFGWYIDAIDDQLGAGIAAVGANIKPIPLPAGLPLLVGSLAVLAFVRRRSRTTA